MYSCRRGIGVPQSRDVVEAAPVPDLLGSILSGQSMLMMDSSDVVINRDGSLKATKPGKSRPFRVDMDTCRLFLILASARGNRTAQNQLLPFSLFVTVIPALVNPGCGKSSILSDACPQISPAMSPNQADSYNPIQSPPAHPRWQPPCPGRPTTPSTHRVTNELPCPPSSMHAPPDSRSKSSGIPPALLKCKKLPTKPMWEDVSVLPRIPKIKREGSSIKNGVSSSSSRSRIYNVPETGMNSYGGDKGRQQSVEQRKGRAAGETQSSRSDTAGSSSTFSSSFSTSDGFAGNQPRQSASSSSSSTVSFRINASGNSWHSRRLSMGSSSSGSSTQEVLNEKKEEARKKQLRRDKQMLLASRTLASKEEDGDSIYDPFNPTQSDSSSSEDEAWSRRLGSRSQNTAHDRRAASWENDTVSVEADVKEETHELVISEDELSGKSLQGIISKVRCSKVEKGSRLVDSEAENQTPRDHKVKDETVELNKGHVYPTTSPNDPSASAKKTEKAKTPCSKSPSSDLSQKKVFHSLKEQHTGSSETDRGGRLDQYSSDHAFKEKEKKRDVKHGSGHSRARKRKSTCSSSNSSLSNSPDRTHGRQSRSRLADRRDSR